MYDVFISCKSEDYSKAKDVYNWLKNQGYSPFFADISLMGYYAPGKSAVFGKEVDKALDEVDNMIVLASKAEFTTSKYVEEEWRLFVEEQRAGRKSGNIITILDGVAVADLPIKLRNVQSFTLNNYKNGLLGYLPKREAVIEKGNSNKEQEQKAREEREQLRRELEIERNRRKEEENMRRLSEQKRVWLEHKLEADRQSSAKDNNQNKKRKTPLNPRKRLWMPIIAVLFAVVMVMVLTSRVSKPDLQPQIETITVNGVSFNMVYVEGGTFKMGATEEQGNDSYNDEKPSHYVTLSDYYIGETEVTQELWKAVMGNNPSYYSDVEKKPVDSVSWNNVQEFITKLSNQTNRKFRLPTEAEWEYAARGGNQGCNCKYSGDDSIDKIAWYYSNSKEETHPVAQLRPNELGLYDMSGNVWEWCQDWYSEDYYYSGENFNPNGPSKCNYHVLRGGSCVTDARRCRVSNRYYNMSQFRYRSYGFRLVMSL